MWSVYTDRDLGLPVERLPEAQDHKITKALLDVGRGEYHGFVSSQPSTTQEPKPLRKGGARTTVRGRKARGHVNGRGNYGERSGAEQR